MKVWEVGECVPVVMVEVEGRGRSCCVRVCLVCLREAGADGMLVEAVKGAEVGWFVGARWMRGWRTEEGQQRRV